MPPRSKKWARKGKKGKKREREPRDDRISQEVWVPNKKPGVILRSPVFEAYYRAQQVVPEDEWEAFMAILREPLPASFRVNLDCDYADSMLAEFEGFAAKIESQDGVVEGGAIKRLEWFKEGRAYQLGIDRRSLRRNENLEAFHEFVKMHTDIGTITRQEAVSMIPPIVLDVQSHHKVLDMCAAPGSKTSQMLEALIRGAALKEGGLNKRDPEGFVIANDADTNRAYMLVHQCKRLSTANLCVTTHNAQHFPGLGTASARGVGPFDRVLCDVPCSGDGTVRKTLNIWRSWTPMSGMGLHPMQLQIALRGASLLAVGGLMVYSTCSLNPIEDEAVVAALLQESQGALELVDGRPYLPGLKSRPGLHTWLVMDSTKEQFKKTPKQKTSKQRDSKKAGDVKEGDMKDKEEGAAVAMTEEGGKTCGTAEGAGNGHHHVPPSGDATTSTPAAAPAPTTTNEKGGEEEEEAAEQQEEPLLTLEEHLKVAELRVLTSPAEFPKEFRKWRPTVFPPEPAEAARLGLDKCLRLLPHDQNTGGFFIALLRKVGPMPTGGKPNFTPGPGQPQQQQMEGSSSSNGAAGGGGGAAAAAAPEAMDEDRGEVEGAAATKTNGATADAEGGTGKAETTTTTTTTKVPYVKSSSFVPQATFEPLPDESWEAIRDFYGLREDFPREQLLLRNGASKVVTYVSKSLKDGLEMGKASRHQLVHLGVKLFYRDSKLRDTCPFRVVQEGLPFVIEYLTKRKVPATQEEFCSLIRNTYIHLSTIEEPARSAIKDMKIGGFVFTFQPPTPTGGDVKRFDAVVWKGQGDKLNLMAGKFDANDVTCRLKAFGHWIDAPPEEEEEKKQEEEEEAKGGGEQKQEGDDDEDEEEGGEGDGEDEDEEGEGMDVDGAEEEG